MRQKEPVKHSSHCFLGCSNDLRFVLCFREEGPRAVTALYFGWPAFRNRHFITGGGGGAGGEGPPPIIFIPGTVVNTLLLSHGHALDPQRSARC